MFEKIKNYVMTHQKTTGVIVAVIFAIGYYFTRSTGQSGATSGGADNADTTNTPASDIYTPPAGAITSTSVAPSVSPVAFYDMQSQIENQNKIASANARNGAQTIRDLESNRLTNVLLTNYLKGGVDTGFAGGFNQSVLNTGGYQSLAESLAGVAHTAPPITVNAMPTATDAGQRVTVPPVNLLPTTPSGQISLVQKIGAKPTEATGTTNLANAVSGFIAGGPVGAVVGGVANTIVNLFKRWF